MSCELCTFGDDGNDDLLEISLSDIATKRELLSINEIRL